MGSGQSVLQWSGLASSGTHSSKGMSFATKMAIYKLSGKDDFLDADGALDLLEEFAKKGDSEAMWMLGFCCEYGLGIEKDTVRAEALYRQSCEARNPVGEFLLENDQGGRGTGMMIVNSLWYE